MRRLKKLGLSIFWCCFLIFTVGVAYSSNSVDVEKIKLKIDPLLASKDFQYDVIKVSEPLNNILAVFLNPSCRDFPNVIFFSYDQNLNDYNRIYEGLCVGIQDESSGKVDLHTLGLAVDMKIDDGSNIFENESVRKMIELGNKSGCVVIPYQNFTHMQGVNTEFYTIDKTKYLDYALKLIGNVYKKYPKDSCVMFDTPNITDAQFTFDKGLYTVVCKTDNKQLWTITFEGIDQDNKYLVNKKIEVKKL